jgi:hypothetical protein
MEATSVAPPKEVRMSSGTPSVTVSVPPFMTEVASIMRLTLRVTSGSWPGSGL